MIVVIKLHQFTFHLDTSNGAVTQFLSKPKGYSVTLHAGHPMISKVYARYAQDEAMAGKQFNGHTYVKLWDLVINKANGNVVTSADITSLFK